MKLLLAEAIQFLDTPPDTIDKGMAGYEGYPEHFLNLLTLIICPCFSRQVVFRRPYLFESSHSHGNLFLDCPENSFKPGSLCLVSNKPQSDTSTEFHDIHDNSSTFATMATNLSANLVREYRSIESLCKL